MVWVSMLGAAWRRCGGRPGPRFVGLGMLAAMVWQAIPSSVTAGEAYLVRAGQPQGAIVVPAQEDPVAQFAADELRHHIQLITGAELPLLKEHDPALKAHRVRLYVGRTDRTVRDVVDPKTLPDSGYALRTVGEHVFFAGHDQIIRFRGEAGRPIGHSLDRNSSRIGSMLAVYDYLENDLGVRWLWPGDLGTHYVRRADLALPQLDREGQPRYIFKVWRVPQAMRGVEGWSSQEARDSFLSAQSTWLRRHRYLQVVQSINAGTHSFKSYWQDYGQEHPEYFARLPHGRREPLPGDATGSAISMCVSQPALWKRIVDNWQQSPKTPLNVWLSVGENDSPGICTCEGCRALDAPHPGFQDTDYWGRGIIPTRARRFRWDWSTTPTLSDRFAYFYRAVHEEARKTVPEVVVGGFAYANYAEAPRQTRLHENIFISLVPSTRSGMTSSTYFPYTQQKSEEFRAQWDGWVATGARVSLRPNLTLSGHHFPIAYEDTFGRDVLYAVQNGMAGSDFDSLRGSFATQGPTLYALARVQERPELGIEGARDEYFAAFGEAEAAVRAYFQHWRALSAGITQAQMVQAVREVGAFRPYTHWFLMASELFTEEEMAQGRALMQAAHAVQASDPQVARRVHYLDLGLQDVEKLMTLTRAFRAYQRDIRDETLQQYARAMADLQAFREQTEAWHLANRGMMAREEGQIFDSKILDRLRDEDLGRLPLTWQFRWDPQAVGQHEGWFRVPWEPQAWQVISYGAWQQQQAGLKWFSEHGSHYNGDAWYRTPMQVPMFDRSREQLMLRFGAVDETARVWVDGKQVLDRVFDLRVNPNAWQEAFEIDLTDQVEPGQTHQLTVRVQSLGGLGGITQPVHLQVQPRANF